MTWMRTLGGRWLDHPCRVPSPAKGVVGDRWQCKCGQVWQTYRHANFDHYQDPYAGRRWMKLDKSINPEELDSGAEG